MKQGRACIWREEKERKCRVCETEKESVEHIIKECKETREEIPIEEFLRDDGKG